MTFGAVAVQNSHVSVVPCFCFPAGHFPTIKPGPAVVNSPLPPPAQEALLLEPAQFLSCALVACEWRLI